MSREEGGFFYYLALLIGMGLVGAYFWYTLTYPVGFGIFNFIMFISGVILLLTSFAFAYLKTRMQRVVMTIVSGLLGGIHFLLVVGMFEVFMGIILFAWIAFGLLLAFAAFNWLLE